MLCFINVTISQSPTQKCILRHRPSTRRTPKSTGRKKSKNASQSDDGDRHSWRNLKNKHLFFKKLLTTLIIASLILERVQILLDFLGKFLEIIQASLECTIKFLGIIQNIIFLLTPLS